MNTRPNVLVLICLLLLSCGSKDMLDIGPHQIGQLETLRSELKFQEHLGFLYPGAPSEAIRIRCESRVNALISRLITGLETTPSKETVLREFQITLAEFGSEDSEERDRLLGYLEDIMAIVGLENSDGLLSEWRYGFDPAST